MRIIFIILGLTLSLGQLSAFTLKPYSYFGPMLNVTTLILSSLLFAYTLVGHKPPYKLLEKSIIRDLTIISTIFITFSLLAFINMHSSVNYIIKIMFILIPLFILTSTRGKIINIKWQLKLMKQIFFVGLFLFLFLTFVICEYDPYLGKFYSRPEYLELMKVSSNGISEVFVITCLPFGVAWLSSRKSSKLLLLLLILLPLIHWSKSHLVIYVFSLLLGYYFKPSVKNIFNLIFSLIVIIFIIKWLLLLITEGQASHSLAKLAMVLNYNFTDIHSIKQLISIIGTIGDETRSGIYLLQLEWLSNNPIVGYGDNASKDLLDGYDFHSVIGYYWVQFGLIPMIAFYLLLIKLTMAIHNRNYKKISIVCLIYFFLKGLFSTINPVFIMLTLTLLLILDRTEEKTIENNRFS